MPSPPLWLSIFIGLLQLANCQFALRSNGMASMVTNGETGHIYAQMAPIVPEVVVAEEPLLVTVENGNGGDAIVESVEPVTNGNGGSRFFFRSNANGNGAAYATAAAPAPAIEVPAPAVEIPAPAANGYETAANGARFFGFFRTNGNGKGNYAVTVAPAEPAPTPAPLTEPVANGYTAVSSGGRIVGFLRNTGNGYATVEPAVEPAPIPAPEAISNGYSVVSNGARFSAFFRSNANGNGAATNGNGAAAAAPINGNGAATAVNGNGAAAAVNGNGAAAVAPVNGNGYSTVELAPLPAPEVTSNGYSVVSNGARFSAFFRTNANGNGAVANGNGAAALVNGNGAAVAAPVNGNGAASAVNEGYISVAAPAPAPISNGYNGASNGQLRSFFRTNGNGGYSTAAPAAEVVSNGARFNAFLRTNGNGAYSASVPQVEEVTTAAPAAISSVYAAIATNGARFNGFLRTNGNGGYSSPAPPVETTPAPVPAATSSGYATAAATNGANGARFNKFLRTNGNGGYSLPAPQVEIAPVSEAVSNGYATIIATNGANDARFSQFFRTNSNGGSYGATPLPEEPAAVPAPITNGYSNGQSSEVVLAPPQFLPTELAEGVSIPQIPGVAGVDYPIYSQAIVSTFSCQDKATPGYYADVETKCQIFRICEPLVDHFAFICPNGTTFNEKYSVCDWWYNVNCQASYEAPAPAVSAYGPPPPPPTPIVQTYAPPPPQPTPAPIVQLYAPLPPAPIVETYAPPPPPPSTPAPIVHMYIPEPIPLPPPPPAAIELPYGSAPVAPEEAVAITEATITEELVPVDEVIATNGNGEALRMFGNVRIHPVQPSVAVPFRFNSLRSGNGYLQPVAVVEEVIPEAASATNHYNGQATTSAPTTNGNGGKSHKGLRANRGRKQNGGLRANRVKGLRNNGNGAAAQYGASAPAPIQSSYQLPSAPVTNGNGAPVYGQAATVIVTNGDAGVAVNGNGVVALNGDSGVAVDGHGRFNMHQFRAMIPLIRSKQILRSNGFRNEASASQYGATVEVAAPAANGQEATAASVEAEEPVGVSY